MTKVTLAHTLCHCDQGWDKKFFQGVQRLIQTSTQLGEGIREPVLLFESATQFYNNYLKYKYKKSTDL